MSITRYLPRSNVNGGTLRRESSHVIQGTSNKWNTSMTDRRTFLAALGTAMTFPLSSGASTTAGLIGAQDAHDRLAAGKLILIDIRTPDEWIETGVAPGAWPLDMRRDEFGSWIVATLERNPDHEVAIICRTGNRSGRVMDWLSANGVTGVLDVGEGMVGGPRGKGWIPLGLPVVEARQALDAMPKDLRAS
jgi:rhodanese-related sulfurtransferase